MNTFYVELSKVGSVLHGGGQGRAAAAAAAGRYRRITSAVVVAAHVQEQTQRRHGGKAHLQRARHKPLLAQPHRCQQDPVLSVAG